MSSTVDVFNNSALFIYIFQGFGVQYDCAIYIEKAFCANEARYFFVKLAGSSLNAILYLNSLECFIYIAYMREKKLKQENQ